MIAWFSVNSLFALIYRMTEVDGDRDGRNLDTGNYSRDTSK